MSVGIQDVVLTKKIIFGLGFASLAGMSLAGSKNWFDLLNSTQSNDKKRKMPRDYQYRTDQTKNVKTDTAKEKSSKNNTYHRKSSTLIHFNNNSSAKGHIPVIKITRASGDFSDLSMSMESTDEKDYSENFVYECPGLAASGEDMTVENPLFNEKLFEESYRTPELAKKFWKHVFTETI